MKLEIVRGGERRAESRTYIIATVRNAYVDGFVNGKFVLTQDISALTKWCHFGVVISTGYL